jgi:hypothetical protein
VYLLLGLVLGLVLLLGVRGVVSRALQLLLLRLQVMLLLLLLALGLVVDG